MLEDSEDLSFGIITEKYDQDIDREKDSKKLWLIPELFEIYVKNIMSKILKY